MTAGARNCVVLIPCLADQGWRDAIGAAALAAARQPPPILDSLQAAAAAGYQPTMVLAPKPPEAAQAIAVMHGVSVQEGWWHASQILSEASEAAHRLPVFDEAALRLARDLPGIGHVEPPPASSQPLNPHAQALGIYSALPPAHGACAALAAELFRFDERAGGLPQLDITGRARILVWGPYLTVPAGRWRLKAIFSVCRDAARQPLRFEFGQGEDVEQLSSTPGHPGRYEAVLTRTFMMKATLELRLWLMRPAFHGRLTFHCAELTRLEEVMADNGMPTATA